MADVTTGLVLGKYAPLHAGHQLVIETALAEVDHLIAVVYAAPSHTSVPLNVRPIGIGLYWVKDVRFISLQYVVLLGMAIYGFRHWVGEEHSEVRRHATPAQGDLT